MTAAPLPSLEPMTLVDGICVTRPHGSCSLVEAVDLVKSAIAHCRERHVPKLLFNSSGLTDVPVPSLVDRFLMVEDWAYTAKSMVIVALVIDDQYIHPDKFGVVLAADLGLTCDVFTSEATALRWLQGASRAPS